jgi:hypothetical protein
MVYRVESILDIEVHDHEYTDMLFFRRRSQQGYCVVFQGKITFFHFSEFLFSDFFSLGFRV